MKKRSLRLRSHRLWHVTFALGTVVIVYLVLERLAPILTPILAALGMAYLLNPLVERLHRRGLPRAAATSLLLLGFVVTLAGSVLILVPLIFEDAKNFASKLPALSERAITWVESTFGVSIPHDAREAFAQGGGKLEEFLGTVVGPLLGALGSMLRSLFSFVLHTFELLLIPVFAFYFLLDWQGILDRIRSLIPPRHQPEVIAIVKEIDEKVSHWLRGQLIVVSILALLYAVALSIVGIQLAVPIGILAGLLTIVPYVGTAVGLGLAALMAVLDWQGPAVLIGVGVVFATLHALEAFVLTPVLVGTKVGLGEAGALFAVIAGAELLGFVGIMLAVPLAAAVAVLVRRSFRYYARTEFFTSGAPKQPAPPPPEEATS